MAGLLILLLVPMLVLGAVSVKKYHMAEHNSEQARLEQAQQKELCRNRTELYELLLYAQKKYRETGEKRYLQDIKGIQTRIAACESPALNRKAK